MYGSQVCAATCVLEACELRLVFIYAIMALIESVFVSSVAAALLPRLIVGAHVIVRVQRMMMHQLQPLLIVLPRLGKPIHLCSLTNAALIHLLILMRLTPAQPCSCGVQWPVTNWQLPSRFVRPA
jgi:hypothetical protein